MQRLIEPPRRTLDFNPGEQLLTMGLDMQCHQVIVDIQFVRYLDDADITTGASPSDSTPYCMDCVVEGGGIKTKACSADLWRAQPVSH